MIQVVETLFFSAMGCSRKVMLPNHSYYQVTIKLFITCIYIIDKKTNSRFDTIFIKQK